ncbi:hypothetical protein ACHAXT_007290 [Thalassiosira profunda]
MAAAATSAAAIRSLCQGLLLLASLLALVACPYSKVEESFNLQAAHDLFYHGVGPAWRSAIGAADDGEACAAGDGDTGSCPAEDLPYDHLKFPGVVPRTFLGPFVLSTLARALSFIVASRIYDLPSHPMVVQFLVRLELLLLSWMAHIRLSKSVEGFFARQMQSASSMTIGNYYLLITAVQFHIPFYSSRLLPNTFALLLVTHAYAEWFDDNPRRAAICLVFTTAIFRCDVILLLFTVGLMMLIRRHLSILQAIATGVLTGVCSLLLTVPLDSLLWGRPIWPEFEVWWFNAVDNRSSEWGTQPWHWYFSRALPKGLLLTALLVPLAFVRMPEAVVSWAKTKQFTRQQSNGMLDSSLLWYFAPVLGFVVLYSFLPHKEMRFLFPALPMFNVCVAYGMGRLHEVAFTDSSRHVKSNDAGTGSSPSLVAKGMYLCGVAAIAVTLLGSLLFVRLSRENYPGGVALGRLKHHLDSSIPSQSHWDRVSVHIDVAAAMTGVSLFGQRYASHRLSGDGTLEGPFRIDKSGYEEENSMGSSTEYTHLLTEQPKVRGYHLVEAVPGHPRLDIRNFRIETRDAIFIQERDKWHKHKDLAQ